MNQPTDKEIDDMVVEFGLTVYPGEAQAFARALLERFSEKEWIDTRPGVITQFGTISEDEGGRLHISGFKIEGATMSPMSDLVAGAARRLRDAAISLESSGKTLTLTPAALVFKTGFTGD